jgi:hypothetical protein
VRRWALDVLARYWVEDPAVRALVQDRATEDPHEQVRSDALDVLAEHWPEKPTANTLVRDLEARAWRDSSDAGRDFLVEYLVNAPYAEVRITAARLLGSLWSADTRAIAALRAQGESDPDPEVPEAIAEAVAMAEAYAPVHDRLC